MRFDADRILRNVSGRYSRLYAQNIQDLAVAIGTNNFAAARDTRHRLGEVIRETMGVADIMGAVMALRATARELPQTRQLLPDVAFSMQRFADQPTQTVIPSVTFAEALRDMVDRTPATIRVAAERTAARIAGLYAEGRVVAFARSAEEAVTRKVQQVIATAIREGRSEFQAGRNIIESVAEARELTGDWSEGYARMAFRTNLNTAVTAGKFRVVQDPAVQQVIPAFMFDAIGDADTRPNHEAGDGRILSVNNSAWHRLSSPLGYNCRCTERFMGRPELKRRGLIKRDGTVRESTIPDAWRPDEGFRHSGRPDLFIPSVA